MYVCECVLCKVEAHAAYVSDSCVHWLLLWPPLIHCVLTSNVLHVVSLRPADIDEVLAVGFQWSWLKVVYFLDSVVL